ncbi:hypothetical protein [Flavobacterium sp. CAU 1735]|uniref:hypothetical protein n=1 Tax=Flavobacterium sp. CAU 1735 TaxID=3140361 RepID=UPI003260EC7F
MDESKFFGKGGWLARQFRRGASLIRDTPILRDFFGQLALGLDFAADGAEAIEVGFKTTANISLSPLEEQQLDAWADQFLIQLSPRLEDFARYQNNESLQQKIDILNNAYKESAAIKAHFAAATTGLTTNQVQARNTYVQKITEQLMLKAEHLTTDLPAEITVRNTTVQMSKINTNGITANSPVTAIITPQISTNVKTGTVDPVLIIPNIPTTGIPFTPAPNTPVKDVAVVDPIKVDPNTPATNTGNNTTGTKTTTSSNGKMALGLLVLAGLSFVGYKALSGNKKKSNKK